jgi:hypothetical protein
MWLDIWYGEVPMSLKKKEHQWTKREVEQISSWQDKRRRSVFLGKLKERGLSDRQLADLGINVRGFITSKNKSALLARAFSRAARPSRYSKDVTEKRIGRCLVKYTHPTSGSYDAEFTKRIISLRPDWFVDTQQISKSDLIELAECGGRKPRDKSDEPKERRLGHCLSNYIQPMSGSYDAEFAKKIKLLRPDWFADTAQIAKAALVSLANEGKNKPKKGSVNKTEDRLANSLSRYLNPKTNTYDAKFAKKITALRPDWFEGKAQTRKGALITIAKQGKARPNWKSKNPIEKNLARAISHYCGPKSEMYDREFTNKIKSLRPDWFVDTAQENKLVLIAMAKKGTKKPSKGSENETEKRLAKALANYTGLSSSSYDAEFAAELRKLRADWFSK